jgi:GDPmannose 4,6-dehydratase
MSRTALITGITGQDGSYLAEFLLQKGYEVFGLVRRTSSVRYQNIEHILPDITLLTGDMLDQSSLTLALDTARPDEVYNLAAMSHVGESFKQPAACAEYNGVGVVRLLEAIRLSGAPVRFYQASTSELFGQSKESPQNEDTPFHPRSPYGVAKLYGHWATVNYREAYSLFACSGILFNHESPRRSVDFLTRKVSLGVARIKNGLQDKIHLGNLNARRDWGYAADYVEAMWLMLQQEKPDDFVVATGKTHYVSEFVKLACEYAGLPKPWCHYVDTDSTLYRPADVEMLCGDAFKARHSLGWQPTVDFHQLVMLMVESDLQITHPNYERKIA